MHACKHLSQFLECKQMAFEKTDFINCFFMHLIFAFHILDSVLTKDIHLFNCFLLYFAHSRPFPLPPPFLQRSHTQQKKKRKVSVAADDSVSLIKIIVASISVLILTS